MIVKSEKISEISTRVESHIEGKDLAMAFKIAYRKDPNKYPVEGKENPTLDEIREVHGPRVYLDEALDILVNREYETAVRELKMDPAIRPRVDIDNQIDLALGMNIVFYFSKPIVELGHYKGIKVKKNTEDPQGGWDDLLNDAMEQVVEGAKVQVPDEMTDTEVNASISEIEETLQKQGFTLEQYLEKNGMSLESMKEQLKFQALIHIKTELILKEIATKEKIRVTEEELDQELQYYAQESGMDFEMLKAELSEAVVDELLKKKALSVILDNLIVE